MAQFRELAAFAQFASDLDATTKGRIELGRRITEVLKQNQYQPMSVAHQTAIVYAVTNGFLNEVPVENVKDYENKFHKFLDVQHKGLIEKIPKIKDFAEIEPELKKAIEEFNDTYGD